MEDSGQKGLLINGKPLKQTLTSGKRWRARIIFGLLLLIPAAVGGLFLWARLTMPDVTGLKTGTPGMTALMRLRMEKARRAGKPLNIHREWLAFKEIPGLLKDAVRVSEDAAFYFHNGIDFQELKEAAKRDLRERRFVRGGSTITQQLAKNLYLSTEKSLVRKLKEILIARRLEKVLSKDRIFEIYLNTIELGPGVFGVQAASRRHFGCGAGELGLERIVRLTAVIPRPLRTDPKGSGRWLRWRCRWILDTLKATGKIGEDEYRATLRTFQ